MSIVDLDLDRRHRLGDYKNEFEQVVFQVKMRVLFLALLAQVRTKLTRSKTSQFCRNPCQVHYNWTRRGLSQKVLLQDFSVQSRHETFVRISTDFFGSLRRLCAPPYLVLP